MVVHRILAVVVLICLAVASPCLADKDGAKLTGQVSALLAQHDKALAAQDITGIMKTYLAGPEIFLMGTGPGEIYRGQEGVSGAYNQFFTRFDKGSLSVTYDWVSAGFRGDVAWFCAEGTMKGMVKDTMKEMGVNFSGTLLKQKGTWRFVAMHFSKLGVMAEPQEQVVK